MDDAIADAHFTSYGKDGFAVGNQAQHIGFEFSGVLSFGNGPPWRLNVWPFDTKLKKFRVRIFRTISLFRLLERVVSRAKPMSQCRSSQDAFSLGSGFFYSPMALFKIAYF
ncbi:hypothetical protein WBJ53_19625 [Spirosoma sp. SC4-14]|uniref:hypothetical protein n=1 Tax=Spirosoma sp. SC4-14 TaxID=3128900 RepID=UPI0030CABC25